MACCFVWARRENVNVDLLDSTGQFVVAAIREDWLQMVRSRDPKQSRNVYARLTADAVALYDAPPPSLRSTIVSEQNNGRSQSKSTTASTQPIDVILLRSLSQLLGRGKGSDHMRLVNAYGDWWEFNSKTPEDNRKWVEAISARLNMFRHAKRVSTRISASVAAVALQEQERTKNPAANRLLGGTSCWHSLAMLLPCGKHQHVDRFSRRVSSQLSPYLGDREGGHSDLIERDRLAHVSDPDLQEAQAAHWSEQAVNYLRRCERIPEELVQDFVLTLRFGVPDGLKRLIWPLAIGERLDLSDANRFYSNLTTRAFGSVVPEEFQDPVPTFCQGIQGLEEAPPLRSAVKHLWLLTPSGETALRRLLWCMQLTNHIEFSPFLPNLFATLLAFFSEPEAMLLVSRIIQEVHKDPRGQEGSNPRIILTRQMINKQAKLLVKAGKRKHNVPEVIAHLEHLGLDLHGAAAELLQDGCAHALPFRALCRVMGSFLREGSEVILRYALALLRLRAPQILACGTSEAAKEQLQILGCDLGETPDAIDNMTKVAYSMVLQEGGLARQTSTWGSAYIAPKKDYSPHIFCRPRLFEPRGKCPDEVWETLWSFVPQTCRILDPRLIYTPAVHGTSLRTCLEITKKHKESPMVFFLFTTSGDIIGGFSPQMWVRTSGYLRLSELSRPVEDAFVFRRLRGQKTAEAFCWSGDNELVLQASEVSGMAFGGDSAAIFINKDLLRAHTSSSQSFRSPPLLQADIDEGDDSCGTDSKSSNDFEVLGFEVLALA